MVAVLFNAGAQVPLIPLLDVVGNGDKGAPEQIGVTALKVGVTFGLTAMINVAVVAHWPAVGVKVYTVVPGLAVLTAGLHVPVMGVALVELVGNTGAVEF